MSKTAEQLRQNFLKRHGHLPGQSKPAASAPVTEAQKKVVMEAIEARDKAATAATAPAYHGKDYMTLVEEYRDRKGGTLVDAMMVINRKYPEARADYIRRNNPHLAE